MLVHTLQRLPLPLVLRDDPLPRLAVRHAAGGAEVVEALPAADAECRLEGGGRVVEARVDDLAVAGGGLGAEGWVALEEEGGGAGGEGGGGCEADDAAAYYLGGLLVRRI